MIISKHWVFHGLKQKGNRLYCPVVRISGPLQEVYRYNNEEDEPSHREILNRKALERYGDSESRWRNNRILRDFYTSQAKITDREGRKKTPNSARKKRCSDYLQARTHICESLGSFCNTQIR